MALVESAAAFSAFETQLRTLCLGEFPCGTGSWRENKKSKASSLTSNNKTEEKFSVTLRDYGAQYEKTEALEELISMKKSPWKLDYSWSNEAKSLREIAVRSPWLIDQKFILNFFKTLRICDKQVEEVDKRLLQFENLEELTLSSNLVTSVNSENLPSSLKVLELCANQVSDLSGLCIRPPPLIHLGLGLNKVSYIGDYLTGDYWPHLLSLDLSHNNLSDLLDVIRKLSTVFTLRNLVLQGNPLALIPGYRGYTVDSLRKLTVLDDMRISADEKHHFKGLARRREFILDEAKVFLEVHNIKGISMPEELKNPDEQPEYPIVEKKFYVEFMYLEDLSCKADVFNIEDDRGDNCSHPDTEPCPSSPQAEPPSVEVDTENKAMEGKQASDVSSDAPKVVLFAKEAEIVPSPDKFGNMTGRQSVPVTYTDNPSPGESSTQGETTQFTLAPIQSDRLPWSEDLEMDWRSAVVRDDLVKLRDFFKAGMELRVLEEKVLAFPAEIASGRESSSPTSKKSDKSAGKADKSNKGDKKKDDKAAAKGGKDGKKKKKEAEEELTRSPPEVSTVAVFHVCLEELLAGEFELEYQFSKVLGEEGGNEDAKADVKKKDGKKDKEGKKKEVDKKEEIKGKAEKGRPKSVVDKKDAKGKGKGAAVEEDSDEPPPPDPPLEVSISIRLHHWKTAYDSVKEEEERNKSVTLPPAGGSNKGDH